MINFTCKRFQGAGFSVQRLQPMDLSHAVYQILRSLEFTRALMQFLLFNTNFFRDTENVY